MVRAPITLSVRSSVWQLHAGDLFQEPLLRGVVRALQRVAQASAEWNMLISVGLPLVVDDLVFNCAVTLYRGRALLQRHVACAGGWRR